jgi:hypothetical protein
MEGAVRKPLVGLTLAVTLALGGCGTFGITDQYGTQYGGFFDYGNQYVWQLRTCESDPGRAQTADPLRKRWMQCCMWRHGVPIDDSNGCTAPPYYNG